MEHCTLHSILGCAQCAGTAEPREVPEDHGTSRKRYTVPPRDYLRPLYNQQWRAERVPAPQARPFGHGTVGARPTEPQLHQPLTVARVRRTDGVARYTDHSHRSTRGTAVAPYGTPVAPQPPDPYGELSPELARLLAWTDTL